MSIRGAFLASLGAILIATQMIGCGGGSDDPVVVTTPVRFSVDWPQRTRGIQAPTSALSATLAVTNGAAAGGNLVVTVDRHADTAAYSQTYTSAQSGKTGVFPVTITFYDQVGGAGDVVASGQANVTIKSDGTGIGDIVIGRRITSVTVAAGQTVPFSGTAQLTFTARDAGNAMVAVSPGSARWELVGTTQALSITADGVVTGLAPGTGEVRTTVDGVSSDPVTVTTLAPPDFLDPGFEEAVIPTGEWFQNDDVSGTPWSGSPNWGIADGAGSWGTFGANGTAQYAYVQAPGTENQSAIKQTITGLQVGKSYRVSLWIARRNGNVGGNVGALVIVRANGVAIMAPTSPTNTGSYRQLLTNTFVATQGAYEFSIEAVRPEFPEDQATLIDDVHLEAAPDL